jgi:transposase-like protein
MKQYSKHEKELIEDFASIGYSGRKIAKLLGVSKSGVNEYLNNLSKPKELTPRGSDGPRILVFDLETAAALAYTFGRFKINLSQDNIHTEGGWILCASWTWLGSDKIESIALTPEEIARQDDSRIVKKLWELYIQADAVVAHNAKSFDQPVLQARATFNGLQPLPTVKVLDTLLLARRYLRLPSNKLDSIGEYFGLGRKQDTGGIKLWAGVQSGCTQAMQTMLEYCKQDVLLLQGVYLKLRALGTAGSAFNAALYYNDDKVRCSACGSDNVHNTFRGTATSVSTFEEYRCDDCGAVHRGRTNKLSKSKRKSLLVVAS